LHDVSDDESSGDVQHVATEQWCDTAIAIKRVALKTLEWHEGDALRDSDRHQNEYGTDEHHDPATASFLRQKFLELAESLRNAFFLSTPKDRKRQQVGTESE